MKNEDSYQRQRRNLFITSFAVITLEFADVKLDTLSLQGYLFKVENPGYIFWALITLIVYFAWRNYQYLRVSHWRSFKSRIDSMLTSDRTLIEEMAIKYIDENKAQFENPPGSYMRIGQLGKVSIAPEGVVLKDVQVVFTDGKGEKIEIKMINQGQLSEDAIKIQREKARRMVIFDTPEFTEHYLPFIFAAFALVVGLLGKAASSEWMSQMKINIYH